MMKIKTTIRQDSANNNPDDIIKVKQALTETGYYKIPQYGLTPYPDKQLYEAINNFQTANNLKTDGVIKPNGETLAKLNQKLTTDLKGQEDDPAKSPTYWCPICGAPHGGSAGDLCPDCNIKG